MVRDSSIDMDLRSFTELKYKIVNLDDPQYTEGHFQQIEVQPQDQRRGVATGMVEALFEKYPDVMFQNENLNDKSGPLFQKIARKHPTHMHQVYRNGQLNKWMVTMPLATPTVPTQAPLPFPPSRPIRPAASRQLKCGLSVVSANGAPCIIEDGHLGNCRSR